MPSLAAMEMGAGGVTSAPELSPHFKTDPKTFLPRLSEEFSSVLTPFILDIYVSSSPSAFLTFHLEAKPGARGAQPITGTSPAHIRAPKKVQKFPFGVCRLEWALNAPSPQEHQFPHRNTWSCWVEKVWCSPHCNWVDGALQSVPHRCLTPHWCLTLLSPP